MNLPLRTLVLFAGLTALLLAAPSPAPAAPDDTFPGEPIRPSPITGHLGRESTEDIFSIYLRHGQLLIATATFPSYNYYEFFLFPPGAKEISYKECVPFGYLPPPLGGKQIKGVYYAVPEDKDGTYSLAVCLMNGAGDYELNWKVVNARPEDAIPGIPLPPSPVIRTLDTVHTFADFFRVHLKSGQKLTMAIKADVASTDYNCIDLYGPYENSPGYWSWPTKYSGVITLNPLSGYDPGDKFSYAVPPGMGGDYYICVSCQQSTLTYRLDYKITAAALNDNVPGQPLPASPFSGSVDAHTDPFDVYAVYLKTGQSITVIPGDLNDRDINTDLYLPGLPDIADWIDYGDYTIGHGILSGDWVRSLIAPRSGVHFLVVSAGYQAKGNYRFQYSLMTVSEISRTSYTLNWINNEGFHPNMPYNDRGYNYESPFPAWIIGQRFIVTMNADKDLTDPWSFRVDVPVTVVVAINISNKPAWLSNWTKLSDELSVHYDPSPRRILYARNFPAGKITLGGNRDPGQSTGHSMYSVMLLPPGTINNLNNDVEEPWALYE